jgi:hypothetical protein
MRSVNYETGGRLERSVKKPVSAGPMYPMEIANAFVQAAIEFQWLEVTV